MFTKCTLHHSNCLVGYHLLDHISLLPHVIKVKPFVIRHHVYADDLNTVATFYPDVENRGRIEEATTA